MRLWLKKIADSSGRRRWRWFVVNQATDEICARSGCSYLDPGTATADALRLFPYLRAVGAWV